MWTTELFSAIYSNIYLLGILFVVFFFLLNHVKSRKPSRFPKGPPGLPIIGNVLQMDFRNPQGFFQQISKKYGNIFSLKFFNKDLVVLNGYEVLKEVLYNRSEDVADRPRFGLYEKLGFVGETKGVIIATFGHSWKEQRRFTLTTLRNFGMGKKSLEDRVLEEAQCLSAEFKARRGEPFNPHFIVNNAVANVICAIAFGNRFEYGDAKFQRLLYLFDKTLKAESGFLAQLLNDFPWLTNIKWLNDYVLEAEYDLFAFLREVISDHKKTWNPDEIRDFIDAYLLEMEKVKGDLNTTFTDENIVLTTYDLFAAGSETTNTTLRWALLFMLLYPDVQSKVQEEIDRVLGREKSPTMANILEMPYTNAVIHEIQRFGDILPLALPHMTSRDMDIQGCLLPKGTTIITNLSSVLKDEQAWEKPYQFYPKHFLDDDGKFVKQQAFMAFSAGRRNCVGEQLARMELFLFFTTLLQQFTFEIPKKKPRPRDDPIYAFTHSPQSYEICAIPRM